MADISKCNGANCPIKEKCYRFTAPDGVWQPYDNHKYNNGCEWFWDNRLPNKLTHKNDEK